MGTFVFKWPHPAEEVYVTGTFDDWSKSEKLEKVGDIFEKKVTLKDASKKVFYKFVVDGTWTTDHTAPRENDDKGNENNVLKPEDIVTEVPFEAAAMNSVGPQSTTAELAGAVPKEKPSVPGGFPETPATELEKEFNVNPLPATDGAVNPIKLAPGEKVPESVAAEGINNHVTLDKESYEKSDRLPGLETELPPVTKNMIPESSLPVAAPQDVTINTVTADSTTAALAGAVPLEEAPKVPEVVKESQEAAKVAPEASANSEEIKEKAAVEEELLKKVPEAPSTAEGTAGKGTDKSEKDKTVAETVAAAAVAAGAAAATIAVAAQETVGAAAADAVSKLPESVQSSSPAALKDQQAATNKEKTLETVSPEVPLEVKDSIAAAGESPEAAANTAAVEEKKEVEAELLEQVKPTEPVAGNSEPAAQKDAPAEAAVTAKPQTNGGQTVAPTTAPSAESPAKSVNSPAKSVDSPATAEKKKKNRLSSFFGKLKGKVGSSKDKA